MTEDQSAVFCSREEFAGTARRDAGSDCYIHSARGPCPCGVEHAPADPVGRPGKRTVDRVYRYRDEAGTVVFEVVRYRSPKDFRQRRPLPNGQYEWNLRGIEPVLYRLPELIAADPAETIFIVEGEKDSDALAAAGLTATTNAGGAGKWRSRYGESLRGRRVAIVPDNDQKGRDHARQVALSLCGVAASVKIVELPGLPPKGDASDFLGAGGTADRLRELADATPEWIPPANFGPVTPPAGPAPLATIRASQIRIEPVEFLDGGGYLPLGKLVTVAGLGGAGKGTVLSAIAADLTAGRPTLGSDRRPPGPVDVLMIGAEDGAGDTIGPRLLAAGADMDRIHVPEAGFSLVTLDPLDLFLRSNPSVKLVAIDPITGYMGRAGVKDNSDAEVRSILEPLADLAGRRGTTIIIVKHMNKSETKSVAERIGGSIGYVNVARGVYLIGADPADDGRRIMAPVKWNLPNRPTAAAWRVEPLPPADLAAILDRQPHLSAERRSKLADQLRRVVWDGTVDVDPEDLMAKGRTGRRTSDDAVKAAGWLKTALARRSAGFVRRRHRRGRCGPPSALGWPSGEREGPGAIRPRKGEMVAGASPQSEVGRGSPAVGIRRTVDVHAARSCGAGTLAALGCLD